MPEIISIAVLINCLSLTAISNSLEACTEPGIAASFYEDCLREQEAVEYCKTHECEE